MRVTDYELSNLILRIEQDKTYTPKDSVVNLGALRDLVDMKLSLTIANAAIQLMLNYRYHSSACAWHDARSCDCGSDEKFKEAERRSRMSKLEKSIQDSHEFERLKAQKEEIMKRHTVEAFAIMDKDGRIVTAANNPRVFFDRNDAADEAWKFRDAKVVRVEIRVYQ